MKYCGFDIRAVRQQFYVEFDGGVANAWNFIISGAICEKLAVAVSNQLLIGYPSHTLNKSPLDLTHI